MLKKEMVEMIVAKGITTEAELKGLKKDELVGIIESAKRKENKMSAKEKFEAMNAGLQVTVPVGDFDLQDKGVIEVKKEEATDKSKEGDRLAIQLMIAWMFQTEHPYNGGKSLFYKGTDKRYIGNYLSSMHKLYATTIAILERFYPETVKGSNKNAIVLSAYNVMIKRGLCHKCGNYIHMSEQEYKKCWDFYKSNKVQGMVASYEAFLKGGK